MQDIDITTEEGDGPHIRLLQGAAEFFPALIAALDAAHTAVQFETYLFDFTGTGATVAEALVRAAQRGVHVRVVVDGVGTGRLPAPWRLRFRTAGVRCLVYAPLGLLGLLLPSGWRRLHRKLCVVDGQTLFCGGINVLDDFHDPNHGPLTAPRLDFAVQLHGPWAGRLVLQASDTMERLWQRMVAVQNLRRYQLPAAVSALRAAQAARHRSPPNNNAAPKASLLLRDNLRHRARIENAYLRAIAAAREEIIIANAYFLPGRKLRRALVLAAQRGVRVQLLLQGRYEYFLQYHGARPVYGALLAAGIEIHEYEPSFLHAKVAVIDAQTVRPWATVGSSNLDPLSLLLAREANVALTDRHFALSLRQQLLQAMQQAGRVLDPARYAQRPWRVRLLDRIAFGLVRIALWLHGKNY